MADDENRPLLKGRKNTADIEALIEKRRPAYEAAANYRVATDQKTSAEIAEEILEILEKRRYDFLIFLLFFVNCFTLC